MMNIKRNASCKIWYYADEKIENKLIVWRTKDGSEYMEYTTTNGSEECKPLWEELVKEIKEDFNMKLFSVHFPNIIEDIEDDIYYSKYGRINYTEY